MVISLAWDNPEKTRILWTYLPGWTWDDFAQAAAAAWGMAQSVPHDVDVIFDANQTMVPLKGRILTEFENALKDLNSAEGIMVVCNLNPLARSIMELYSGLLARRHITLLTCNDVATARKLLEEHHPAAPQTTSGTDVA